MATTSVITQSASGQWYYTNPQTGYYDVSQPALAPQVGQQVTQVGTSTYSYAPISQAQAQANAQAAAIGVSQTPVIIQTSPGFHAKLISAYQMGVYPSQPIRTITQAESPTMIRTTITDFPIPTPAIPQPKPTISESIKAWAAKPSPQIFGVSPIYRESAVGRYAEAIPGTMPVFNPLQPISSQPSGFLGLISAGLSSAAIYETFRVFFQPARLGKPTAETAFRTETTPLSPKIFKSETSVITAVDTGTATRIFRGTGQQISTLTERGTSGIGQAIIAEIPQEIIPTLAKVPSIAELPAGTRVIGGQTFGIGQTLYSMQESVLGATSVQTAMTGFKPLRIFQIAKGTNIPIEIFAPRLPAGVLGIGKFKSTLIGIVGDETLIYSKAGFEISKSSGFFSKQIPSIIAGREIVNLPKTAPTSEYFIKTGISTITKPKTIIAPVPIIADISFAESVASMAIKAVKTENIIGSLKGFGKVVPTLAISMTKTSTIQKAITFPKIIPTMRTMMMPTLIEIPKISIAELPRTNIISKITSTSVLMEKTAITPITSTMTKPITPQIITDIITIPKIPVMPLITWPMFGGGGGDFGFPKRRKSRRRKYAYTPSLWAFAFGIRGKKPKGIESGLRFRPITKGWSWGKTLKEAGLW